MDRLMHPEYFGECVDDSGHVCCPDENCSPQCVQIRLDRLAAYESAGVTPRAVDALVNFAIRAECDYMEKNKMSIHINQLKQALGYSKHEAMMGICGKEPVTFENWIRFFTYMDEF